MKHHDRRRIAVFFSTLTALALASTSVLAGPWTKSQGEYYVKLGESLYLADAYRNSEGQVVTGADYLSATSFVYAEYGLLDGLHIQAFVPLLYAKNTVAAGSFTDLGVGDATLGLQMSPLKLAIPTSIRLEAKIPMYTSQTTATGQTPARGDAQLDATLWLSGGAGNASVYGYLDVGYQHRTQLGWDELAGGPFSDGLVYIAQVGYWAFGRAVVALNSSGVLPLTQDTVSKSYVTVGPSIFFPLTEQLSLEADAYLTPYSRNSANGWSVGFGLSYRSAN
jgi:hypothetical protein